jgi:hypothetical protein
MAKIRAFHATSVNNVKSILAKGLVSKWEGVYLTDSEESACRWIGFRLKAMGESQVAVIEVEVDSKKIIEGTDHSPVMVSLFGVGKSMLSPKTIPPDKIVDIHYYSIGEPQ